MSLVGSSVNVVTPDHQKQQQEDHTSMRTEDDATHLATAYQSAYHDSHDAHPPPTPPGAAESLFLSGLHTSTISASALAEQIHHRHRPFSLAGTSIATDDFASATDGLHSSLLVEHDHSSDEHNEPFGNDALIHSREALVVDDIKQHNSNNMAKTTPEEPMHVDPAEKIYGTAKGVWGWGKGIIIFKPFMGLAEGIAGKIVETAGSNLEDLDSAVLDKLHGLDDGILNPAIAKIVGTLLGAKGKTEDFVMPILTKILSPFGLLKDGPEGESNLKPDGSKVETKPLVSK